LYYQKIIARSGKNEPNPTMDKLELSIRGLTHNNRPIITYIDRPPVDYELSKN